MIPQLNFGRTGHNSTRVIFGSWALSQASQKDADQVLELLLEFGINHIDTARIYGNAEKLIGSWMKHHREDFFVASKTRKRTYRGAIADLHQTLQLLGIDQIDLWQMHSLTNPVGWETAMGSDGALKAFIHAREKGLVRFLGVTGHGNKAAKVHLRSLERFDFDSILLPYSYWQMHNPNYASDFTALSSICRQRNTALQTIKAVARRPWNDQPKAYNTYFYEPLVDQDAITKSVHWVLGFPDCFLVSAGDMQILPKILQAASSFVSRPAEAEMDALVAKYQIQPVFNN
jgi:aryl-alcohol dehydrogenase-like predicted oxidoreductase